MSGGCDAPAESKQQAVVKTEVGDASSTTMAESVVDGPDDDKVGVRSIVNEYSEADCGSATVPNVEGSEVSMEEVDRRLERWNSDDLKAKWHELEEDSKQHFVAEARKATARRIK